MDEIEEGQARDPKADPTAPHETSAGARRQHRPERAAAGQGLRRGAGVTGLVLTKLDGSAKGGILARRDRPPVPDAGRFVGVGEGTRRPAAVQCPRVRLRAVRASARRSHRPTSPSAIREATRRCAASTSPSSAGEMVFSPAIPGPASRRCSNCSPRSSARPRQPSWSAARTWQRCASNAHSLPAPQARPDFSGPQAAVRPQRIRQRLLPLAIIGQPRRGGAAPGAGGARQGGPARARKGVPRSRSPAASSSAWRLPARSSIGRRSCSPTSRPPTSTPTRRAKYSRFSLPSTRSA